MPSTRPAIATDAFRGEKQHAVTQPLATSTLLGAEGCVTFHTHTYDLPSSSLELWADSIMEGCEYISNC